MGERLELNLEGYFAVLRALVQSSEAPSVRMLRRQWLLPRLRRYLAAARLSPGWSNNHTGVVLRRWQK